MVVFPALSKPLTADQTSELLDRGAIFELQEENAHLLLFLSVFSDNGE